MGISPENDAVLCAALFEQTDGFLCVMDRDMRFVWVNRVRPELSMSDVVGQPLSKFLTSETFEEAQRCAALVLETGKPESFAAHNSIGGTDVWTEGRVGPVPGRPDIFVLTTRNITRQRQAEASLREVENTTRGLIEAFPGIMLVIEPGGTIVAASRDAATALALPDDESYGSNLFDSAGSGDASSPWGLARLAAAELAPVHVIEEHGGRVYDTIAYPILNRAGTLKQIAIVARDITEQRRTQLELQARQERQRHAEKMEALGTLAAGVAHDFNNLLTPIMLNAQRARQGALGASSRDALLESIVASVERGAALVNQILAYGRTDSGDRAPLELRRLVGGLEKLLRGALASNILFEVDMPEREVWVYGSAGRIQQAIINLCMNAEHAMPDGGRLRVELCNMPRGTAAASRPAELPDGDYARIRVLDEGSGIASDEVQRIFEPFYSTKSPDEGSGLGLFVVHGVAAEHEGGVAVQSTLGVSTAFDLWIPIGSPARPRERPPAVGPRPHKALRLLLADDDAPVLKATCDGLRDEGHHVLAFSNAGGLEETFMREPTSFDCAIVDYRLPDGTGLELARRLREHRPDLPILLCSGFITAEVEQACRQDRVGVLRKPYAFPDLLSSIDRAPHAGTQT